MTGSSKKGDRDVNDDSDDDDDKKRVIIVHGVSRT